MKARAAWLLLSMALTGSRARATDPDWQRWRAQASEAWQRKEYASAAALLRKAVAAAPDRTVRAEFEYEVASLEALQGRRAEAMQALQQAVRDGMAEADRAAGDGDLVSLRGTAEWNQVIGQMRLRARELRVFEVTRLDSPDLGFADQHRFDDWSGPKMKELRERYHLREVIAGKKTELERQMALLTWVHGRWSHDGWNDPSHDDALTILAEAEAGKHFRCVQYSVTLAQALQAVGYPARKVGLKRDNSSFGVGKGHVVTEAWNNDLGKWILLDGQNGATWQDGGRFLDAAEVRERFLGGRADRLRMVNHGSPWFKEWNEPEERAGWIGYFDHLDYSADNAIFDHGSSRLELDLVRPGRPPELLFQGDPLRQAQVHEVARIYPPLNQVHVDLGASGKMDALGNAVTVTFTTVTPWFDHFEIADNGKRSQQTARELRWALRPGSNALSVRAVNAAGVAGPPARVEVVYHPPRASEGGGKLSSSTPP
jgi:hypothetical protein